MTIDDIDSRALGSAENDLSKYLKETMISGQTDKAHLWHLTQQLMIATRIALYGGG